MGLCSLQYIISLHSSHTYKYRRQCVNMKVRFHDVTLESYVPEKERLLLLAEFCAEGEVEERSTTSFLKTEVKSQLRTSTNSRNRFITAVEMSRIFCEETQTLEVSYILNPNLISWHYGFIGNRFLKDMQHFLLATLLIEEDTESLLKVLRQKRSPTFQIACMRRNLVESNILCAPVAGIVNTVMRGSEQHVVRRKKVASTNNTFSNIIHNDESPPQKKRSRCQSKNIDEVTEDRIGVKILKGSPLTITIDATPESATCNTLSHPVSSVNLQWICPFSPALKIDVHMEGCIFDSAQESRSSSNWRFSPQSSLRPNSGAFCWTGQSSGSSKLKGPRFRLFSPAKFDVTFCESDIWGIPTPLSREVNVNAEDSKPFEREPIDMDAFTLSVDDTFTLFDGNEESCYHPMASPPPVA